MTDSPVDFYIIGLGNPEALAPATSRHNLGAIFVDFLANALLEVLGVPGPPVFNRCSGLQADILDTRLPDVPPSAKAKSASSGATKQFRIVLVKPMLAMNQSGDVLKKVLQFFERCGDGPGAFKAHAAKCLVFCDDLNSPIGALNLQVGGDLRSLAGHKGVEDVAAALETTQFPRFRLGIGRPPAGVTVQQFVLSEFADQRERDLVGLALRTTTEALQFFAHTLDLKATKKKFGSCKVPNNLLPMQSLRFPVRLNCI
eukprot:EG_transcript_22241